MTQPQQTRVRASDAERERVVQVVQQAGGDGRLTMPEVEERLAAVYATRYRDELAGFTADLPADLPGDRPEWPGPARSFAGAPAPLLVHAAIVAVFAIALITRWAVGGAMFFWPAFPLFWLTMSLVVHARARRHGWPGRRFTTSG